MLIFLIVSLILVLFSFYSFKKTFCFYTAFKMLALSATCIKYTPPALSVETFLNFFFVFEFVRRGYWGPILKRFKYFPLKTFYTFSFVSIVLSSICSIIPFKEFCLSLLLNILNDFVFAFLFWFFIYDIKDIRFFIKCCVVVFSFACFLGIYEFIFDINPFTNFLRANVSEDLLLGKIYEPPSRLGMRRVLSLFGSPNNFIYGAFISILLVTYNKYVKYKNFKWDTLFILLVMLMVLLANSRTVLASSIVILLPVFLSFRKNKSLIFLSIIIVIIGFPFFEKYAMNFISMISTSETNQVEGSTISGRASQFLGAWNLFLKSPFWGNGIDSISYFVSDQGGYKWIIYGTESIWMKLLIEKGILGIVTYVVLFIELYKRFDFFKYKYLTFCVLGYLAAHTISSLPGFSVSFFYIVVFCIYRIVIFNKKSYENRNNNFAQNN